LGEGRHALKVLVGLGNPGEQYEKTRHNVGSRVVEEILKRHGHPVEEHRARSLIGRVTLDERMVLLARPVTYMNRSGAAVAALLVLAKAGPEDLLVVCDDLHLDFGMIRLRPRGSHGGHNGLLSIIESLRTQAFARLRVGVGPADPAVPHADFVLAPFSRREQAGLPGVVGRAADCAETAVLQGIPAAMNRFNATSRRSAPDAAL
jgi:peptidyl-tRNA hydrolase, PTH1 family